MIFRCKRKEILQNFTKDFNAGCIYSEKFGRGVQWYTMDSKNLTSKIIFIFKNGKRRLVSFNGQCITFCSSIKFFLFGMSVFRNGFLYTIYADNKKKSRMRLNNLEAQPLVQNTLSPSPVSQSQQKRKQKVSSKVVFIVFEGSLKTSEFLN